MIDILSEKNVSFGIYNAYEEWGLVLEDSELPYPEQKKEFIEVPGKFDRYIDATYNINNYPAFERRNAKFKFRIINGLINTKFHTWRELVDDIAQKIHGKKMKIFIYESPHYYYEGYLSLSSDTLKGVSVGTVEISADLYPYKKSIDKSRYILEKSGLKRFNFGRMPTKVECSVKGTLTTDLNIIVRDVESNDVETYSLNKYHSFNVWGGIYDVSLTGYKDSDDFRLYLEYERGEL